MWLLKTEPSSYSYDDLEREGRARWDGVTNPQALKNLRAMRVGDRAFIYHTGEVKAAVGIAEITREAYPDPKAGNPKLVVVDLKPLKRLKRSVALEDLKSSPVFKQSPLLRQGRLSVVPLTAPQGSFIEGKGGR